MALERVGVTLVVEGQSDFFKALDSAANQISQFAQKVNQASQGFGAFDSAVKNSVANLQSFKGVDSSFNAVANALNGLAAAQVQAAAQSAKLADSQKTAGSASSNFGSTLSTITGIMGTVAGGFGKLISGAGDLAGKGFNAIVSGARAVIGALENIGGAVLTAGKHLADLAIQGIKSASNFAVGFGKESVGKFAEFNSALIEVKAVSEVTDEEFKQLRDSALELGAKLPISSKQAAEGFAELAKAGFKANEIIKAGPGLANLSVAGQMDMGKASEILGGTLRGFGLEADKANHVVDLLAKTANASAVDLSDLGTTFKYVAPVAKAAGFSMEDMSVAVGIMGNNMIKGSQAGTSLRSIITGLTAPTAAGSKAMEQLGLTINNANGTVRPFSDIIGDLRAKFKGLSQEQQIQMAKIIVGKEAMSGFLAVINASDSDFQSMTDAIHNADGAGAAMAKTMSGGLGGAIENMKGSIEALQIKIGEALAPAVEYAAGVIGNLANVMGNLVDSVSPKIQGFFKDVINGISLFSSALKGGFTVGPEVQSLGATMSRLGEAFKPVRQAVIDFFNTLELLQAQRAGEAIDNITKSGETAHPVIDAISKAASGLAKIIDGATQLVFKYGDSFLNTLDKVTPFIGKIWELYQTFSPLQIGIKTLMGFFENGLPGAIGAFEQSLGGIDAVLGTNLMGAFDSVVSFINLNVIPALNNFGNWFMSVGLPAIQNFANWFGQTLQTALTNFGSFLSGTVMPILNNFGSWFVSVGLPMIQNFATWIGSNLLPILQSMGTVIANNIVPFVANLADLILNTVIPTLSNWAGIIASALAPALEKAGTFIAGTLVPAIGQAADWVNNNLVPAFKQVADFINANLMPVFKTVADFLGQVLGVAFDNFATIATFAWNTISNGIQTAWGIIKGIWDTISAILRGDLTGAFQGIGEIVSSVWSGIQRAISGAWDFISGIFKNIDSALGGPLSGAFEAIQGVVSGVWDTISAAIGAAWNTIEGIWNTIVSFLSGTFGGAFKTLGDTVKSVWDTIVSTISGAVDKIKGFLQTAIQFFSDLPGNILKALGDLGNTLLNAGKSLIQGLINGIKSLHIPLPHINVTFGSIQVGPASLPVPNFDIQWYAKGGIFNAASLIGVGEGSSPEAVLPLNEKTLAPAFAAAMQLAIPKVMSFSPAPSPASIMTPAMIGGNSSSVTNNYNLTANVAQNLPSVQSAFAMMEGFTI